jgi:hypothetical protein
VLIACYVFQSKNSRQSPGEQMIAWHKFRDSRVGGAISMRALLLVLVTLTSFTFPAISPGEASAAATTLTRAEIRAMPILERPNRPGHFYGNAVRRRHGR